MDHSAIGAMKIQETKNYGRKGGKLRYEHADRDVALALSAESDWECRWSMVHVQLYVELGLDQAEYHANWGV